jgi:hypothetical protein
MPLDVLVPGLVPPIDAPPEMRELRLPALEKWLARAQVTRHEAKTAAEWLASTFSLSTPAPVAAISLASEGERPEGAWLAADPVHVRIERERTSMHSAAVLDITREEADALVAALQSHFAGDGLEFRATAPDRWHVRVPREAMPETTSLDEALGRDVRKLLPAAKGAIKWPAALTEIQMIFAAHEVNAAREAAGRPGINSIWLSGGGMLPPQVASPYSTVRSADPFAQGLASLAGTRIEESPERLSKIPASKSDWTLATCEAPLRAIHRGDPAEWIGAARDLDRDWFGDLGDTIARFGTVRVALPSSTGTIVAALAGASRWRFFASRKPLSSHA